MTVRNNALTGAIQQVKTEHPTGGTIVIAVGLVALAERLKIELSREEALAVVAGLGLIASAFSPRFNARKALADNEPEHGGTGPDVDPEEAN